MSGPRQMRRKKWECLFCFKKVGNDRKTRECTENMFNSCVRHLPSEIIGQLNSFEDFQNNNGPFCAICFQSAQQLSTKNEILSIVEKEMGDFVTSLTVSMLQNRNASFNTPFEYESNIDIQILQKVQNYIIEIQEESGSPVGIFDCYEEEVVQETEVEKQYTTPVAAAVVENEEEGNEIETLEQNISEDEVVQEIEVDEQNISSLESEEEVQEIEENPNKGSYSGDQPTRSSSNTSILKKIVLQTTPSGKVFVTIPCECGMTFESDKQMKEHSLSCAKMNSTEIETTRSTDIRYRCGVCGFLARSIQELREHKIMRHAKKYECNKCEEKFRLKTQLKAHTRAAHRNRLHYQCSKCAKYFYSEKLLLDHEDEHKTCQNDVGQELSVDIVEKPNTRQCEVCGAICTTKTQLNYHMISKHSDKRPFECSVCHRKFKIKRFLDAHLQTHMQVKNFLCGDQSCGKSFATFRLLEQHTKLEHTDNHFKCELCDFKTLIQKRIDIHKAHYHDLNKQFECRFCGVRVSSMTTLHSHERIHTGEKPHKCNICDESFRTQNILKLHKNRKHAERKFQCPSCDFVAGAQFLLDSHALVHSENKPFQCEGCGNTFKTKSSKLKHKRLVCKVQR